jgi:hypothetical protein
VKDVRVEVQSAGCRYRVWGAGCGVWVVGCRV